MLAGPYNRKHPRLKRKALIGVAHKHRPVAVLQ